MPTPRRHVSPEQPLRAAPSQRENPPDFKDLVRSLLAGWRRDALCATDEYGEAHGRTWIVEKGTAGHEHPRTVAVLLSICAECPVRSPCALEALSDDEVLLVGAWGGSVASERAKVLPPPQSAHRYAPSRAEQVSRAYDILQATLSARIDAWNARADLNEAVSAANGKQTYVTGHPTGHLLSFPERLVEDTAVTMSGGWKAEQAAFKKTYKAKPARKPRVATDCANCSSPIPTTKRSDAKFCSRDCKAQAWNRRQVVGVA